MPHKLNHETFDDVPETLLDPESKEVFRHAAIDGDIYAYRSIAGVWNLNIGVNGNGQSIRFEFVGLDQYGRTTLRRI